MPLFYRIALTFSPVWVAAPPQDHGLLVERGWSLPEQARLADRDGPFRCIVQEGDLVRLRVRIITAEPHARLVVDVPVPAGLRPVPNPADPGTMPPTLWDGVENQGLVVRLFKDVVTPGVYEHTLVLRAVTPGTWPLPPVRARALHTPGISGESAAEELLITPAIPLSG